MFRLLQKSRILNLLTDINASLFDSVISPVLLYGCEKWANNDPKVIEQIHLKFCTVHFMGEQKSHQIL